MSQAPPANPDVTLVGAGDPEFLTLRALRVLQAADVVVHDSLVSPDVLALAGPDARLVSVDKTAGRHTAPQDRINVLLVDLARRHHAVVRLKGGGPFISGRGGEEAEALRAAGVEVEVVHGITAAEGAAASLAMPLTQRGLVHGLRYVTGHCRVDLPLDLDRVGVVDPETTLVVYMGAANIAEFSTRLVAHGLLPVRAVSMVTTPSDRRLVRRLGCIDSADAAPPLPMLFVIDRVVTLMPAAALAACAHARELAYA